LIDDSIVFYYNRGLCMKKIHFNIVFIRILRVVYYVVVYQVKSDGINYNSNCPNDVISKIWCNPFDNIV